MWEYLKLCQVTNTLATHGFLHRVELYLLPNLPLFKESMSEIFTLPSSYNLSKKNVVVQFFKLDYRE